MLYECLMREGVCSWLQPQRKSCFISSPARWVVSKMTFEVVGDCPGEQRVNSEGPTKWVSIVVRGVCGVLRSKSDGTIKKDCGVLLKKGRNVARDNALRDKKSEVKGERCVRGV